MSEHLSVLHSLPPQPTTFVGRREELADIARMLADPSCRLVTLVGPGGIGKTRLAIEAASQVGEGFPDGVVFVPLQPVRSPDLLVRAIADAIGCPLSGSDEPRLQLLNSLRNDDVLLLLDNFEHLLDGVDLLTDILAAAGKVRLLVTSREALNLQEEFRYSVQGLEISANASTPELERFDAVRLFVERARQVRQDFNLAAEQEAVVRICRLVGGMPLAIELAAAWTKTLPCAVIASEIERNLEMLATSMRNVPDRHRSVRAAFDQSWELLAEAERQVFARLSVFRGGFGREAAEKVAGATLPILATLFDKSLLRYEPDGRFHLHELLRQYAEGYLRETPEEAERVRDRHCDYYIQFLATHTEALSGGGQREAAAEIAADLENVRAAWQRAVDQGAVEAICRANYALTWFHQIRGSYLEGVTVLEPAVLSVRNVSGGRVVDIGLASLLRNLGWLRIRLGRLTEAREAIEESRALYARLDVLPEPGLATDPLLALGILALIQGEYAKAAELGEEARRRGEASHHIQNLPYAWYLLAEAALAQGQLDAAHDCARHAYTAVQLSRDRWFMAYCLNQLGHVARALGKYTEARQHYQDSYALREEFDDPEGVAVALNHLAKVALLQQDFTQARQLYRRSFAIYEAIGDQGGLATSLHGLAVTECATGEYHSARQHFSQALQTALEIGFVPLVLTALRSIGAMLCQTGQARSGGELLMLVVQHPAADQETRDRAQQLLDCCDAQLLPAELAATRAEDSDLDSVVARLLVQLAAPVEPVGGETPSEDGRTQQREQPLIEPLTDREMEMLRLIADGRSNRQISEELFLTVGTVKWYTSQIYGKLGVESRSRAVSQGRLLGLLP